MSYADRDKSKKLTGRWVGEVDTRRADGTELRYRKRFASKGEADGYEAYIRATGQEPVGSSRAPTNSFRAAAERFKAENKAWVDAHGTTNSGRLEYAIANLGNLDVGAIRKTQLIDFVKKLKTRAGRTGQPPSNRTVNNYVNAVRKVLRDCFEREEIDSLPVFPREENTGKDREVVLQPIEDAACNLLDAKQGTDRDGVRYGTYAFLIRILAMTGMRRGELYALRADQIETPEQSENTGWMLTKEQTKTNLPRWVPMQPEMAAKLRALIASNALPKAPHLAYQFKQAVISAGGSPDLTVHCLRHTTVTRLLEAGAQSVDVAKLTGHAVPGVPAMQMRYYHPDKPALFKVAEKVHNAAGEITKSADVLPLKTLANRA